MGQLIKTLVSQKQSAGNYAVQWDGSNELGEKVASGIYTTPAGG
ncbi:MAG: FlgD immunoglobulin-like domain containing protein [Calditrichia bacterium]